jgi:hypothetical protein
MHTATPALDLLDVISLAESEAHFENAEIVPAERAKKPANRRRQPFAEVIPVVFHPAASARPQPHCDRTQEQIERANLSQSLPDAQIPAPARSAG